MTIITEISRPRQRHFRRLYMRRRQQNGEFESTWQLIPETKVIKFGKVTFSVDEVQPSFFKQSDLTFEVSNFDGYFSDVGEIKSFFYNYASIYNTMVKLDAGYTSDDSTEYPTVTTLFIGLIGEKVTYKADGTVIMMAKHLANVFKEFPADQISGLGSSLTASEVITAIRDHVDGNAVTIFQKYISLTAWNITATTQYYDMATSTSLQGISCHGLMKKMAEAENFVFYVDRAGDFYFKSRADVQATSTFHFSGIGDTRTDYGHNILDQISLEENIKKVYNRIRIKISPDDTTTSYYIKNETWNWADSSSSFLYGVREYRYENTWMNTAGAITVSDTIFQEFQWPSNKLKLKSKFVPQLMVQDRVDVTYKTKRVTGDDQWGFFLYEHGYWGDRSGYNINLEGTNFIIQKLSHDVDKFESTVDMKEL